MGRILVLVTCCESVLLLGVRAILLLGGTQVIRLLHDRLAILIILLQELDGCSYKTVVS